MEEVPAGQAEQIEAPPVEKEPAKQGVHVLAPPFEYVPAGQVMHDRPVEYVPAEQDVQELAPVLENDPAGHGSHIDAPAFEKVPAAQKPQTALDCDVVAKDENLPAGQAMQLDEGLVEALHPPQLQYRQLPYHQLYLEQNLLVEQYPVAPA